MAAGGLVAARQEFEGLAEAGRGRHHRRRAEPLQVAVARRTGHDVAQEDLVEDPAHRSQPFSGQVGPQVRRHGHLGPVGQACGACHGPEGIQVHGGGFQAADGGEPCLACRRPASACA